MELLRPPRTSQAIVQRPLVMLGSKGDRFWDKVSYIIIIANLDVSTN